MLFDNENREVARNYTYQFRTVAHELDKNGAEKKTTIRTYDHFNLFGHGFNRLIAKDDRNLSADDERKEEERYRKFADKWQHESEADRAKRLAKQEKDHQEDRHLRLQVPDAFDFKLLGSESVNGRDTWKVFATPRTGYRATTLLQNILKKLQGTIWVDKADYAWAKVDVEMIDDFTYGGILLRLHKGTRLQFDQLKVNDEIWLMRSRNFAASARIALFKSARINAETTFSNYRKFKTDTRVTGVSELPAAPPNP